MQIIIDMPEEVLNSIKTFKGKFICENGYDLIQGIKNGTPLPKGHGRMIDGSKLKVELECGIRAGNYEEGYEKYPHINSMDDCIDAVKYADTIIKADNAFVENIIKQAAGELTESELTESIKRLKLSVSIRNALKRGEINTIGELVSAYTHGKLIAVRGLGAGSYKEIEDKLTEYLN